MRPNSTIWSACSSTRWCCVPAWIRGRAFVGCCWRRRGRSDLAAFAHADVPFERLVEVLNPERSTARHPLFQVMLAFQNMGAATLELPGLSVASLDVETGLSQFDLQLILSERYGADGAAAGIGGWVTFRDRSVRRGDGGAVRGAVRAGVALPSPTTRVCGSGEIDLLERARAGSGAGPLECDRVGALPVPREAHAGRRCSTAAGGGSTRIAAAVAVVRGRRARLILCRVRCAGESAGAVADRAGVGPESLVAVAMRRSLDQVVAMYAMVAAGGAYVPIDPDHPGRADRVHPRHRAAGVGVDHERRRVRASGRRVRWSPSTRWIWPASRAAGRRTRNGARRCGRTTPRT